MWFVFPQEEKFTAVPKWFVWLHIDVLKQLQKLHMNGELFQPPCSNFIISLTKSQVLVSDLP